MNANFKRLLATGGALALILGSAAPVFAASEAVSEVVDDGDANAYANDNDNFSIDNHNRGHQFNLDVAAGVSGLNDQDGNDDDVSMFTGDADGLAGSENFLNSNVSEVEEGDVSGSALADASVGDDGNATATADDNDSVTVENCNHGFLANFTVGAAISGLNSQSGNDDGNRLSTGDSWAMASAANELNNNWTTIGSLSGDSSVASANVADDGNAIANAYDNDNILVKNHNHANLLNVSAAVALSGGNDQSDNDDNNELDTGSSIAESSANNYVNNNITVVGESDGDAIATAGGSASVDGSSASAEVGDDGNATATASSNDTITVDNHNNADVDNVSVAAGVSGGNTQSNNDDGVTMTTGSASGTTCSTNTVNSNWTVIGGWLPEGGDGGCN